MIVDYKRRVSMPLVLNYKFDQSDPRLDSSGNDVALVEVVDGPVSSPTQSVNDSTYGTVAEWFGNSGMSLPAPKPPSTLLGDAPRSFSVWTRRDTNDSLEYVFWNSGDSSALFWGYFEANNNDFTVRTGQDTTTTTVANAFSPGTWAHIVTAFDGTTLTVYINGVLETTAAVSPMDPTSTGWFAIGYPTNTTAGTYDGRMSDFRVYDDALDSSAVSQLFSDGPNPPVPDLVLTAYTHLIDIEWLVFTGASTYHLKYIKDSGTEQDLTTTAELSYTAMNPAPGYSYEIRVYTDLDLGTPVYTETTVTPIVDSTSVDNLMQRLDNNLTLLSSEAVGQIDTLLSTVLATGDTVITSVGITTFVQNNEIFTLPDVQKEALLTSFDQSSGAGQSVSVVLPDSSTTVVSYDEISNEVEVGGTSYAIGTSFISGGVKVTTEDI